MEGIGAGERKKVEMDTCDQASMLLEGHFTGGTFENAFGGMRPGPLNADEPHFHAASGADRPRINHL